MRRLLAVCSVVREGLGLSGLTCRYDVKPNNGTDWASCFVPFFGWTVQITFYEEFFTLPLEQQLATVVHEHIHASMIPTLQLMHQHEQGDRVRRADEITVDHLTGPLLKLLMPRISEVLS